MSPTRGAIVLRTPFSGFRQREVDEQAVDFDPFTSDDGVSANNPASLLVRNPLASSISASPEAAPESAGNPDQSVATTSTPSENTQPASTPLNAESAPAVIGGNAPAVVVAEGASVEISGDSPQPVTFTGTTGTLKVDHSVAFTGQVTGLAGADG